MTPQLTYQALLIVQLFHLLHHRISKRHISFAEVLTSAVLCVSPAMFEGLSSLYLPLMLTHIALGVTQVAGSLFIQKLSPDWEKDSV